MRTIDRQHPQMDETIPGGIQRGGRNGRRLGDSCRRSVRRALAGLVFAAAAIVAGAAALPPDSDRGQSLAANIKRVAAALEKLGKPMPAVLRVELALAKHARDAEKLLDQQVLLVVEIDQPSRLKVLPGAAPGRLQQAGYTPVLLKVINRNGLKPRLRISSPQAGPVFAGVYKGSMFRQAQLHLAENGNTGRRTDRFLEVELFETPPMAANLSGLGVEYVVASIYSSAAGRLEAALRFELDPSPNPPVESRVQFEVKPAVAVTLKVRDHDGAPTMGRFLFLDRQGHVLPPQTKRLAPDLFFQKHLYRADGETVLLPPGPIVLHSGRGPEYRLAQRTVTIPEAREGAARPVEIAVQLERWVDPAARGFFVGDHHFHAAGCAHYTSPSNGVGPADMFRQIKGEGLHVGSVLAWQQGFEEQAPLFGPSAHELSEPLTQMKYDLEVAGFGSAGMGHTCLLNLKEHLYPGTTGTKGWPTWTLPVLRWVKAQGGATGYPHTGPGLQINAESATKQLLEELDTNKDGRLDGGEAAAGLLPESFTAMDTNRDGFVERSELMASHDRVADELPCFALPESAGGPQESLVTTALGACDFLTAMDTHRLAEWNIWYHVMNCGFPLKIAGESDFPCMGSTYLGQGRTYVQLGRRARVDYGEWCRGLAQGRSYISDGYAHALEFTVNGRPAGGEVTLATSGEGTVKAVVAFSPETPLENPYGGVIPSAGRRVVGDTIYLYDLHSVDLLYKSRRRLVELVVNSRVVASREVPADGAEHAIEFKVPIERSSWVALRQFPQLHTNPVNVLVGGKPIRASRDSARWAVAVIDQFWRTRGSKSIAPAERAEAEQAYRQAQSIYRRIADESPAGR